MNNNRPTLGSQSQTLGRLGLRTLKFPLNLMQKPLKIAWNRLKIAWNHRETQKKIAKLQKSAFWLIIAGRFGGLNNNNSRGAEQ